MKKQLTTIEEQSKTNLRRSSRNTTVNKLSTSRRRPKSVSAANDSQSQVDERTDTDIQRHSRIFKEDRISQFKPNCLSPINKQLPIILESPGPDKKAETQCFTLDSVDDNLKAPSVTPKNCKTHSFTENTPFKDDLLACSQHFDPQSDVAWDCRSPDAINFLRKGRRRRHYSDVSEIVTQLQCSKDELQEEHQQPSTPPLLGLWMNDGTYFNHQQPTEFRQKRERRRKDKSRLKSNKKNDSIPKALLEKIQLVMEKCEENGEHANEVTVDKDPHTRSASLGDESKDLFDLTSACGEKQDDDSWSDDELFEDDSFIIKATQIEDHPICNKRKMDSDNSDEPPVKTVKYLENQASVTKCSVSGLQTSRLTRLSSKPSPFKKHKSFNDRHEYEKSHGKNNSIVVQYVAKPTINKQTNVAEPTFGNLSSQRSVQYNPNLKKSCVLNSKPSTCKPNTVTSVNTNIYGSCTSALKVQKLNSSNPGANSSKYNDNSRKHESIVSSKPVYTSCANQPIQAKSGKAVVSVNNPIYKNSSGNLQSTKTVTASSTVVSSSSRRTSGAFDTSLSDDILCQLVEPDEILDSQVPICETNKNSHIGEALSFLHEKPESSFTGKSRVKSAGNPSSSNNKNKYISNKSNSSLNTEKRQNIAGSNKPVTIGQTSVSSNSINTCKGLQTKGATPACLPPYHKDSVITPILSIKQEKDWHKNSISSERHHSENKDIGNNKPSVMKGCGKQTMVSVKHEPNADKLNVKKEPLDGTTKTYSFKSRTPRNEQTVLSSGLGGALENASEDLFMSDDELSEPQLWAMLDTVESATQMRSAKSSQVKETEMNLEDDVEMKNLPHTGKSGGYETKYQSKSDEKSSLTTQYNQAYLQVHESSCKCSPDDIEKKRLAALKLKQTNSNIRKFSVNLGYENNVHLNEISSNITPQTPVKSIISPNKYSPEDIEKKRKTALQRLQEKSDAGKHSQAASNNCTIESPFKSTPLISTMGNSNKSPFKCSPDDIEKKRLDALARRRLHSDTQGNTSCQGLKNAFSGSITHINEDTPNGSQQNFSSSLQRGSLKSPSRTPTNSYSNESPFKCSPDDIEKKRLESLARRKLHLDTHSNTANQGLRNASKESKNHNENMQNEALHNVRSLVNAETKISNNNCTSKTFLGTEVEAGNHSSSSSPFKCSQEEIENKKQEAIKRLQQKSGKNINAVKSTCANVQNHAISVSKTPNKSQMETSPIKCSPEDIERKQLDALKCKQHKSEINVNNNHTGQPEESPFKCSPEDIECKKQEAIKRKKLHFEKVYSGKNTGVTKPSLQSVQSNTDNKPAKANATHLSKQEQNVVNDSNIYKESLCKYSAEDIEKKKQIAMQRRLEKMKASKKLND